MKSKPGKIVIISSPSGGGKSSICKKLLSPTRKKQGWAFSISYTTREKRKNELNGREYYFVTKAAFDKKKKDNFFAESFNVHLYQYGTPRKPIENVLKKGGVLLLDVDVQGAQRLKKEYPQAITIFIMPPSVAELKKRLKKRGTETDQQLKVRFENAKTEMKKMYSKFEYLVINKDLKVAVDEVLSIINSHHCRIDVIKREQKQPVFD